MEDNYSPYCPTCDACGEDGCCNHLQCLNALVRTHPECRYGETYIKIATYNERCYSLCADLIEGLKQGEITPIELIDQYATGTDKVWDEVFK